MSKDKTSKLNSLDFRHFDHHYCVWNLNWVRSDFRQCLKFDCLETVIECLKFILAWISKTYCSLNQWFSTFSNVGPVDILFLHIWPHLILYRASKKEININQLINTVNVRKLNVQFGEPNKNKLGFRTLFSVWNRNIFVRIFH